MLSDGRFEKQKGDSNLEKEDRIRQKEQWKQLSPSEKWQYFIDYYLWVTIGVTTGIVILIFLIVHFATKTSFVMGVMAVNTDGEHIEATGPDYFTDFLREHGVMSKRDVEPELYDLDRSELGFRRGFHESQHDPGIVHDPVGGCVFF